MPQSLYNEFKIGHWKRMCSRANGWEQAHITFAEYLILFGPNVRQPWEIAWLQHHNHNIAKCSSDLVLYDSLSFSYAALSVNCKSVETKPHRCASSLWTFCERCTCTWISVQTSPDTAFLVDWALSDMMLGKFSLRFLFLLPPFRFLLSFVACLGFFLVHELLQILLQFLFSFFYLFGIQKGKREKKQASKPFVCKTGCHKSLVVNVWGIVSEGLLLMYPKTGVWRLCVKCSLSVYTFFFFLAGMHEM